MLSLIHISLTNADKSNTIVIISKKDLDDKTEEFINNNNDGMTLHTDPTNEYQTK